MLKIRRYLRSRSQHEHRGLPYVWIGERGRLADSGLRQLLERIGNRAGVEHVHAHRFRHMAADQWLKEKQSEDGLMAQMGWRSRSMVQRCAAANRQERAREETGGWHRGTPGLAVDQGQQSSTTSSR